MADSVTVRVDGLKKLGERMRGLSDAVNSRIARAATAAGANVIAKAARDKAPVDTGNLRKNIITKRLPPGETELTSEFLVTVRKGRLTKKQKERGLTDAYYARFVEFGTATAAAQPFMRPAFDQNKEKAVEAIKERFKSRLEKVGA